MTDPVGEQLLPSNDKEQDTTEDKQGGDTGSGGETVQQSTNKTTGPSSDAERKGYMLIEQAEAKIKSGSSFFGKLMG